VPALLRSLWDEPRPPRPPAPGVRDGVLVGLFVVAAVVEGVLRPELPWRVASVVLAVALFSALPWRRAHPLIVALATIVPCSVITVLTGGEAPQLNTIVVILLVPYAVVRWGSGREAIVGTAVILASAGAAIWAQQAGPGDVFGGVAVLLAAFAVGAAARYRSRARLRELDQVKLLEREALARDLHDTVAHHVSAIAIRAQAGLATSAADPAAAADALRVIEAEASRTLAEMRTMVRVLRRGEPVDLAPTAGIADLERLASRDREGPAVEVEVAGDVGGLPEPVGAAIYRLAQESVTNARRHARHATRIEVRVDADDTAVRLRVSDDGEAAGGRDGAVPGFGVVGMIERAALLGGTCEVGPAPGRGWTVTAVLPRTGAAG
jgi:signal transduction histidine kinase